MFGPLVRAVRAHGGSARPTEVYEWIADDLELDKKAREALTPGGVVRYVADIQFARWFLVREGILDSSKRGVWALTKRGTKITDISIVEAGEIADRVRTASTKNPPRHRKRGVLVDPSKLETVVEHGVGRQEHAAEVIGILLSLTPSGFENFCQRLLREAGFQNVEVTGRPGDGGIDGAGMLRMNPLVSFKVLFQCKRHTGPVGSKDVRNFRGSIQGRADKGIILTTSRFTDDAQAEAVRDGVPPLELVDGERLVEMLESLEMGLVAKRAFEVKREFFETFETIRGGGQPGTIKRRPNRSRTRTG